MGDDDVEKAKRKLKTFPDLDPALLMHPWDLTATRALGKVPGLETLTKKVMEYGFERVFYLENTADNVRVAWKIRSMGKDVQLDLKPAAMVDLFKGFKVPRAIFDHGGKCDR